jgi:hypothetical protein
LTLLENGNVGIGKELPEARLHIAGTMKIDGANTLEFGAGVLKEVNAGKIGYETFTPGSLDIVGAGETGLERRISFFNEGGATFVGNVGIGTFPNEQLEITGNFRLPPTTATTGIIKSGENPFIHNIGTDNFFAGVNAGNLTTIGFGQNTGVGFNALNANTEGFQNTATGMNALSSNTTGISNTATGMDALSSNTTGGSNTATGRLALQTNTTGTNNTAIGFLADVCSGCGDLTNATAIGANAVVSQSNALVLGDGANVGIGTSTPSARLDVVGTTVLNALMWMAAHCTWMVRLTGSA